MQTGRMVYYNRTEGRTYVVSEDVVKVSDSIHSKFKSIRIETNVKRESADAASSSFNERFSIVRLPGNCMAITTADKIILLDLNKKTSRVITAPPANKLSKFSVTANCRLI